MNNRTRWRSAKAPISVDVMGPAFPEAGDLSSKIRRRPVRVDPIDEESHARTQWRARIVSFACATGIEPLDQHVGKVFAFEILPFQNCAQGDLALRSIQIFDGGNIYNPICRNRQLNEKCIAEACAVAAFYHHC